MNRKRNKGKTNHTNSQGSLASRLSTEVTQSGPDTLDNDIEAYVMPFLQQVSRELPLEPVNLLTKEGAQNALQVLSQRLDSLQSQLRRTHAIKQLLIEKRDRLLTDE